MPLSPGVLLAAAVLVELHGHPDNRLALAVELRAEAHRLIDEARPEPTTDPETREDH